MKPKSGNRFRICGTPSKTGCITCKIRRVKCGEEHPFCKRCTSTGRKCDGYAPPKSPSTINPTRKAVSRSVSRGITQSPEADPLEQQLLYFFRTVTAPGLSGPFSSDFWERRVFQASKIEPSVRHAVIAIGVIHQDYLSWTQSKVVNQPLQAFAFRQYAKAIGYLHQLMSTPTQPLDITLIACICFITFDCLLGNHESAIIHLRAGLKILEDIRIRKSPGSRKVHEWEREFGPILLSLGTQAASFVNPSHDINRSELWISLRDVGIVNTANNFRSLEDARSALDAIAANITVERNEAKSRSLDTIHYHSTNDVYPDGLRQMDNLHSWTEGLDRFLVSFVTDDPLANKKINLGASLLKLHSLIYQLVIDAPIQSGGKIQDVLAHCEYLTSDNNYMPGDLTFTPDIGLIAPVFFTILRAPDSSTRRRAVELLSRIHGREGMWDAQDAMRIARDALDAAGHSEWSSNSLYSTELLPSSDQRMRHHIIDRMVWPFGERWEIPVTSVHSTPQPQFIMPYSTSSARTDTLISHDTTFPHEQMIPQVKVEPSFTAFANAHSQPLTQSAPPYMLQPGYEWASYE